MRFLELKVPPVPLAVFWAAAMWFVADQSPDLAYEWPARPVIALSLLIAGVAFAVAGVREFRRVRTTVNPLRPDASSTLVASGVYRYSRNPMYVGLLAALAGGAYYLAHPLSLLLLPLFVAYMNRLQIQPEERALRARFGPAFDTYTAAVRRWL